MKLADMTLTQFGEMLAAGTPTPGGGSAAALSGALGAALVGMVAGLTVGKKKYLEHEALMLEIVDKAAALRQRFLLAVDADAEAYTGVSAVFALPKDTDEEKTAREQALQSALQACTRSLYHIMLCCLETLELAAQVGGKSNVNAAGDLGVAALCLKSAVQGAGMDIAINTKGIKDQIFVEEYKKNGQDVLARSLALADKVQTVITAML